MTWLIHNGYCKEANYREGNKRFYELAKGATPKSLSIHWKGSDVRVPLREILNGFTINPPKGSVDGKLGQIIIQLFYISASHLENGEQVKHDDLKELRKSLIMLEKILSTRIITIKDLLKEDRLWEPSTLPRELLIKDDEITRISDVLSIIDKIQG